MSKPMFVILSLGLALVNLPVSAAPKAGAATRSLLESDSACQTARKALDEDRGRVEALMLAISDEDDKPESPARFKRMCAIDQEISITAARLAKIIASAPGSCLSSEDKSAASDMKRLSTPVPECLKPFAAAKSGSKAVVAGKPASAARAKTASSPVVKAAAPRQSVSPSAELGLMSDLY